MDECKTEASCATEHSCNGSDDHHKECCARAERVMSLAKCAKHDLLKEKMKKFFEAKIGKKLDSVAKVAVDAIIARMEHKVAEKQACHQYQEKLMEAFKD